ncbi:unnamed protein product, partial [Ectocarpus sp. 12 AP-2014]
EEGAAANCWHGRRRCRHPSLHERHRGGEGAAGQAGAPQHVVCGLRSLRQGLACASTERAPDAESGSRRARQRRRHVGGFPPEGGVRQGPQEDGTAPRHVPDVLRAQEGTAHGLGPALPASPTLDLP